jgi:hypothetical protein
MSPHVHDGKPIEAFSLQIATDDQESAPEGRSIYIFDVVEGGAKLANGRMSPAIHGGEPLDLFALREHAGRSWRVRMS